RGLARVGLARVPEVAQRLLALIAAVRLVVADVLVVLAQRIAVVRHRQRRAASEDQLGEDVLLDPSLPFLRLVAGARRRWIAEPERERDKRAKGDQTKHRPRLHRPGAAER